MLLFLNFKLFKADYLYIMHLSLVIEENSLFSLDNTCLCLVALNLCTLSILIGGMELELVFIS